MCFSLQCLVKWSINVINVLLSVAGALIVVAGVISLILLRNIPETTNMSLIPILVIIFGCVLAVTNICGSLDYKICRLMYAVVMAILATVTLVMAIIVFKGTQYLNESISELLTEWFNDEDQRVSFAAIESSYECCGLTGPLSYLDSPPLSCCPYLPDDPDPFTCSVIKAYQDGCLDAVSGFFKSTFYRFGNVSISISIIGFVGSGLTLFLLYLRKKR